MLNIKKLSIYDLRIKYFNDANNDGIGDLKGLVKKIDYFSFLNVDALILQDLLSSESENPKQNFTSISKEIGTIDDFKILVAKTNKINLKIFIEINLGSIKEKHKWFKESEKESEKDLVGFKKSEREIEGFSKFSKKNSKYYSINEKTQEINLNWSSSNVPKSFVKVIKYWNKMGVSGFVFKNFEFINSSLYGASMTDETLFELRKFYNSVKEINDKIFIIGKSSLVDYKKVNEHTYGTTKIFDYFICSQLSLLGTHKKYKNDLIGKFCPCKLSKIIALLADKPTNILSFGNELSGRINSRWGNEGQYNEEAAKTICLLNLLTQASSSIYYSDELGAKNIGLTFLDDFQDKTLSLRKLTFRELRIKEKDFMAAQVLQNPINGRSLMLWNETKNGGFSLADKTITPVSESYQQKNVQMQFKNPNSILNFYKKVNQLLKTRKFSNVIENGTLKVANYLLNLGTIKYTFKLHGKEIVLLANFSLSKKQILFAPKSKNIILSSYANKKYHQFPSELEAYESILLTNLYDEDKLKKAKEDVFKIKPNVVKVLPTKKTTIKQEEHEEIKESFEELEKTKLKEEEIAPTTQIDLDETDDIDDLLDDEK